MGKQVKNDFVLESKGLCFFCLIEAAPGSKLMPDFATESSSVYSLLRLSRFLKMDVRKVLEGIVPTSSYSYHRLDTEAKVNLKVELCEECASLSGTFSKLHRQLEQIETEVKACVNRIHSKLVEAVETGMSVHFRELMADSKIGDGGQVNKSDIVEALRTEAMQKCASKLIVGTPEDRFPNLQKKTAVSISPPPHPVKGDPNKSKKLAGAQQFTVNPDTGNYRCNICSKELKNRATFRSHHKSSHSKTKYQCPLCDKEFSRRDIYTKHHQTFHGSSYKCELCNEVFTRKFLLKQHRKNKHNTSAPWSATGGSEDLEMEIKDEPDDPFENLNLEEEGDLDWEYSKPEETEKKLSDNDKPNLYMVECNICHLEVSDLTIHLSEVHFEVERTLDDNEGESGGSIIAEASVNSLDPCHQHVSRNPSASSGPRKSKKQRRRAGDDMTKILEANDAHANKTPTLFLSTDAKILPPLVLAPALTTEGDVTSHATMNPETGRLKCNSCSKEFKQKLSFRTHYQTHHLKIRYKCTLCRKEFLRRDYYRVHIQSVHMRIRFKCNICNKGFCQKPLLNKHRKTVHLMEKEERVRTGPPELQATINPETGAYKCPLCPKEFKENGLFQEHYTTTHLKARHLCPVCGKDFPRETHVRRHQQSVHMGVKYKCQVCEKSFTLKYNLKVHLRTTTCGGQSDLQPKPKQFCDICGKEFSARRGLQKHLEEVHRNVRKHMCELCGKSFKTKTHLNTHIQGVHDEGK